MHDLRYQISEFICHEVTPVDSILENHSMRSVFCEIESLLVTETPEKVARILTFVRDAGLYEHPFKESFRATLDSSGIWEIFSRLLIAPSHWVRANTIYTIGKLTCRERSYLLSDVFPHYMEENPIGLPSLLFELRWLAGEWNWSFLEQIANANHYLCRWSLCEILDDDDGPAETMQRYVSLFSKLKLDSNPFVAAEANFRLERVNVKLRPKLAKPEWRKEVKRIASLEPKMTFSNVAMQFIQGRENYSLADFDQFVQRSQ